MRGDPGSRRRLLATLVLTVAVGAVATGCEPPACVPPYAPAKADRAGAGDPWPVEGTRRPPIEPVLDTDGDGVADVVEPADGTSQPAVVVHRGSGDLVLGSTTASGVAAGGDVPLTFGDSDGDGRSEVLVSTVDASGALVASYLVAGAAPDGTHDVAQAGVRLPPRFRLAAGDLDGDGTGDAALGDGLRTFVLYGPDMLRPGPGGTFAGPATEVAGELTASVEGAPGVGVLVLTSTNASGQLDVTLWSRGASVAYTTEGGGIPLPDTNPFVQAWFVDAPDGHLWMAVEARGPFLRFARWGWDLDDPCAGAPPPA
jgi:hypothetical protein